MHDAPAVAVVVCAYTPQRTASVLAAVAEARRQCDGPLDEVVLVVDHAPQLAAALAAAVPDGVVVVESTGPRGLSGARNTGVCATTAELLVFLDDDALPRPGWIAGLRTAAADPDVAVVAGAVHADWEGGRAPRWFPAEFGWVVGCDYEGLPADGEAVRNPIGACMAVRRTALAAAGGFSTELGRVGTLPVGCEETLMGIRVRAELPGARTPRATAFAVDHTVPAARQRVRYLLSRCWHEGRSKAQVARAAGAGAALSSERGYVARVLPRALAREARAALRGDASGLARAAVLVAGLAVTASGYLAGRATTHPAVPSGPSAPSAGAAGAALPRPASPPDARVARDELVTVVVCTLGRDPRLVGTVAAVLGQTHPHLELVLVDNDPASGRVAALLAQPSSSALVEDPRLRLLAQPVRGLSAARNAGLAAARGTLVAYTDDDAVPDPTWLAELLAVLRRDTTGAVALVTGRVLAAEVATVEQEWFEQAGVFDKGLVQTTWALEGVAVPGGLGEPGHRSAFFPYTSGEVGSGNNMVFRTAALRALGGFDEALGAGSPAQGGEDLDVFRRVLLDGRVAVYSPTAVVRHFHRDTYEALRAQMRGYGVGMSAVLTKIVLGGGRPARDVLLCVPRGVWTLLAPSSTKNAKKPAEMPLALVGHELVGYLQGPGLYLRSRRVAVQRRAAVGAAAPDAGAAPHQRRGRSAAPSTA
ncbi:glycosyltransferase family 2 protein [Streptomyces sp. NP160]|uniref:glycosyltransferase n=1 Tax=Streptomyces sp. NP160 TaxID=2586637 RepID=UPI001118531C|nr:glycosyltransferase [Streptomyces sp. NP160]TNM67472.1 glycosyltransferase family 2 protein [Streptomyces sp. NP160]